MNQPAPSLEGPRAKLDRAERQLNALSDKIGQFMEEDVYATIGEANPIDESYSVILEEQKEIPTQEWGLALGEIVHHIRSALDHLVAQLVTLAGRKPHTTHQFPIVKSEDEWDRMVNPPKNCKGRKKRGYLDFIAAPQITTIKLAQPYMPTTGKPSLSILQRFSNADKHRLIHASVTWLTEAPEITMAISFLMAIKGFRYHLPGTPIGKRTEIARIYPILLIDTNAPNREVNVDAKMHLATIFGEPGQEDTRFTEFRTCLNDARAIVDAFAADFP